MHHHNHKLAVSQAYTNIVEAYRHTGLIQTHKLIATQATKLQTCRYTCVTQKLQACRNTGNKTKSLLPHRPRTKLQAYSETLAKTTNLPPHRRNFGKTTSLPPHRRNTKLQTCRHTGVIQNYKLAATQAKNCMLAATQA